jgi:apolipoprotein N-acyltransferase
MRALWMRLAVALAAGALMPLAFAPFGWFPLALFAPAVLFALWQTASPRQAFWQGYLFGLGMFGFGVYWVYISIHVYGHSPLPLAVGVMLLFVAFLALFPALTGYLATRALQPAGAARLVWAMPAVWVALELIRGWFLTGFPWLNIGYSQIDSLLAWWAPVAGSYGVSFMTVLGAALLTLLLSAGANTRWLGGLGLGVLFAASFLLGRVDWTTPLGDELRVSIVQGNIDQALKWVPAERDPTLETYLSLSRREWQDPDWKPALILWPETAIPAFYHEVAETFLPALEREAQQAGVSLVAGIPVLERSDWQYYNALMSLGDNRAFYYKQHLVPFGEYLPLRSLLGTLLQVMPLPVADFSAGRPDQALLRAAGYPMGSSICYEVIFGNAIAAALPEAAWLVNVSNDGWFGDSPAPHQHLEMARMRALETGRYLLRATNTGISAIIDPDGQVRARSPQFETAVVRGTIRPYAGATPYVRFGDYPVILLVAGILLVMWFTGRRAAAAC